MVTKLTLSIDDSVLNEAKRYLQTETQSLSKLVENYFRVLVNVKSESNVKAGIVKEITGVARSSTTAEDSIADYLTKKYK